RHLRTDPPAADRRHDDLHVDGGGAAVAPRRALRPPMNLRRPLTLLAILALLALLAFPLIGDKFYLQLLAKIMLMAIFAMSLDLLVGFTGLVSLGHAAFFGLGAYALWFMTPKNYAAAYLFTSLPL